MKFEDLRIGMRVKVSKSGQYTRDTQGFDYDMEKYLGTQQTIAEVRGDRGNIMFKDKQFFWDPRDVKRIPGTDETKILLKGDKNLFDINELG